MDLTKVAFFFLSDYVRKTIATVKSGTFQGQEKKSGAKIFIRNL